MEVKKAEREDLGDIQALSLGLFKREIRLYDKSLNPEWTYGEGREYFKKSLTHRSACALKCIDDGVIVGYLVGWLIRKKMPYRTLKQQAELENMFVMRNYRSKGVGKMLVDEFKRWAKEKGVDNIKVTASGANKRAIEFYRKCGFKDYELTLEMNI